MPTAATLPAIAKTLDRVLVRLDLIEERQVEFALNQKKTNARLIALEKKSRAIERQILVLSKTIDKVIDYAADTKFKVEELELQSTRLRERLEKKVSALVK